MIVVINPNSSGGHSFKGLHQYCAHDQGTESSSERVDWISTRNVASDADRAWKVMAATQLAEQDLKKAAGVKAGRKPQKGAVMHVVMSFDEDEPQTREAMEAAADDLLASLGADPAKMRGKSRPKRRQFADEHQAVFYAHTDTGNTHLHLMVNTVHPETGIRLPTTNNHLKAQKWALAYSQEHGTAQKTPARAENAEMREQGEYVKGQKRASRSQYEEAQRLQAASNDNDRRAEFQQKQKAKDAALYEKGRALAKEQAARLDQLKRQLTDQKSAAAHQMKAQINRAKSEIRETFRPEWRELDERHKQSRSTFDALESSFWGRTKNAMKGVRQAFLKGESVISRSFRILSNSGERTANFESAQTQERQVLQRKQAAALKISVSKARADRAEALGKARRDYLATHKAEQARRAQESAEMRAAWNARKEERAQNLATFEKLEPKRQTVQADFDQNRKNRAEFVRNRLQQLKASNQFNKQNQSFDQSQNNGNDKDGGKGR